jgi:predicted DNA-binding transcriptional regulator YafY
VSSYGARWVLEDPWHADQRVEKQPDGSILLTVKAAHELEIIPRVLALGAEAEVIAPASCRKMIAEMVKKMAATYGEG